MIDYTFIIQALKFTIYQAVLSTILSLAGGLLVARVLLHKSSITGRIFLSFSLVIPSISLATGMTSVMPVDHLHMLYGTLGIVMGHIFLNLPLATFMLLKGYQSLPSSIYQLISTLDIPMRISLFKLEIPLLRDTLAKSAALIFLLCCSSFTIPVTMSAGPHQTTLVTLLYDSIINQNDRTEFLGILSIIILISALITLLSTLYTKQKLQGINNITRLQVPILTTPMWFKIILFTLLAILFLVPIGGLIKESLAGDWLEIIQSQTLKAAVSNSISVSLSVASIIVILSIAIFCLPQKFRNIITILTNSTIGLPSFVISIALFIIATRVINVEVKSFWLAIIINTFINLPIAIKLVSTAIDKININYNCLINSLHLTNYNKWKWIYFPLIINDLYLSFVITAIYSLSDLGNGFLFDQMNFLTLPVLIYEAYSKFQLSKASILAMLLMFIATGLFGIFLLLPMKYNARNKKSIINS